MTANKTLNTAISVVNAAVGKNRIINGGMDVWQRGTTFTNLTAGSYSADRWYNGGGTVTFSQSTDVPSTDFQYSLSLVSGTSGTYATICQKIESVNCVGLAGKTVTLSFWTKSTSGSANLYAQCTYANAADNWTAETNIGSTNFGIPSSSWTKYTWTVTLPSQVSNGLRVFMYRDNVGTHTTLFTGVQLEVGGSATPFERRQYGTELALCERYYEAITTGAYHYAFNIGSGVYRYCVQFRTKKRAAPTVVLSGANPGYYTTLSSALNSSTDAFDCGASSACSFSAYTASIEL